jgi:hypothetical protein
MHSFFLGFLLGFLRLVDITSSSMTTYLRIPDTNCHFRESWRCPGLKARPTTGRAFCAVATVNYIPHPFRDWHRRKRPKNLGRLFDVPEITAHVREVVAYRDTGADDDMEFELTPELLRLGACARSPA